MLSRRTVAVGMLAGAIAPGAAIGAQAWRGDGRSIRIPDPDVRVLDPAFAPLLVPNALIDRPWTGGDWIEGPAWSTSGRFLVFSDVRRNRQYRMLADNDAVSVFREPSGNSNGNAFDHQGRQVICQHLARRVIRIEHDGTVRVIAGESVGRPLNSPNDLACHPDGSVWFTDPSYGRNLGEGQPDAAGDTGNATGMLDGRVGAGLLDTPPTGRRQPTGVYRWDGASRCDRVLRETDIEQPNGIAFSPDHKTMYVSSTAGRRRPAGHTIQAYAIDRGRLGPARLVHDFVVDGLPCAPDGLKVDRAGNLWCAMSGPDGYTGVLVLTPTGAPIGRIVLPEVCANLAFGGPRRDTLYMCATRSIYRLQLNIQGAAPS